MSFNAILVNLGGAGVITFIVWWFWIAEPAAQRAGNKVIEILVDGGTYTPARIEVPVGETVRLRFLRKDPSPCAEKVIFEGLEVSLDLPVGEAREVALQPPQAGEYAFTCQMQMYRGSLVVT